MSVISIDAGARRRTSPGLATALRSWWARAQERRRRRKEREELSRLSPHLLRDMGLEHYAAPPGPSIHKPWL